VLCSIRYLLRCIANGGGGSFASALANSFADAFANGFANVGTNAVFEGAADTCANDFADASANGFSEAVADGFGNLALPRLVVHGLGTQHVLPLLRHKSMVTFQQRFVLLLTLPLPSFAACNDDYLLRLLRFFLRFTAPY
jgi:hypothetical protein